jgi:hypothetical protein
MRRGRDETAVLMQVECVRLEIPVGRLRASAYPDGLTPSRLLLGERHGVLLLKSRKLLREVVVVLRECVPARTRVRTAAVPAHLGEII